MHRAFLVERAGVPPEHGHGLGAPVLDWDGGNVVDVVLVDFGTFDASGDMTVVAMAALAVLTPVRMRERGETQRAPTRPTAASPTAGRRSSPAPPSASSSRSSS